MLPSEREVFSCGQRYFSTTQKCARRCGPANTSMPNTPRAMEKLPNELLCDVMRHTEESSKESKQVTHSQFVGAESGS